MRFKSGVLVFILITILSQSFGLSETNSCAEEHDIFKLIPFSKILMEVIAASRYDPEVKAAFDHLESPDFMKKTSKLETLVEYKSLINFFDRYHFRIPEALNFVKTILPTLIRSSQNNALESIDPNSVTGGISGLLMRIFESHIPMKEVRHGFKARLACDPDYKEKISSLHSGEFHKLLLNLRETTEYKEVVSDLVYYKIYLDEYLTTIFNFFDIQV